MFILCLIAALILVEDQPKPLPELKSFLAEVRKTLHTDSHLLSQYTYTEKRTSMELDSKNTPKKTEVSVFEVFPGSPERAGYRRRVVKDGRPLSPDELKKEDQDLKKRIEAAQRKRDQTTPAERERKQAERLRREEQIIDEAFSVYEIEMAGRENIGGRPAILLKFRPRLTYKPKTFEGKNMQHVAGRAWIDEQDHQVARVELEVIDPISIGLGILARLQKGASIVSERRKFNNEIWLPVKTEVTLNARVLLLKGFNIRQILEYSEHKKYTVDTILKFSDEEDPRLDRGANQEQSPTSAGASSGRAGLSGSRPFSAIPGKTPVYRIKLRVHSGQTTLPMGELRNSLEEMNFIWWSQAGVCFEISSTKDDTRATEGFDIWFVPEVPDPPRVNGIYKGDHDIWSRDYPSLTPAPNPVTQRAARTSAHELGHALTLRHYNGYPESPDSLMSSGTLGWRLHDFQIQAARARAQQKANPDTVPTHCSAPQVN